MANLFSLFFTLAITFSTFSCFSSDQTKDIHKLIDAVYLNADDDPIKTQQLADEAFALLKQSPDAQLEIKLLYKLAWVYSRIGEIDKAESLAEKSLAINVSDDDGKGDINNLLGSIAWYKGDFSLAINYFFESLAFRNKTGNKENIAASLNNIGSAYQEIYEYENALIYHQKSLEIKNAIGHELGIATSLSNIAVVYYELDKLTEAETKALQSLKMFETLKKPASIAELNIQLGEIYIKQEKFEQAKVHINHAFDFTKATKNNALKIRTLISLSKLAMADNLLPIAKQYINQALEQALALELSPSVKNAHLVLSNINELEQNYEAAFTHYKSYADIYLSLNKNKLTQRIIALEKQLKNAEIQQELKTIEQQNKLKDILLSQQKIDAERAEMAFIIICVLILFILVLYYRLYKKNKHNYKLSITDVLCECYNRTYLFKEYAVKLYEKPQTHFLFLLDIDNFKHFNDTYGHEAGDTVLKTVSKNILSCLHDEVLIRLGGEEFVIIGQNISDNHLLAEKIRKSIVKLNIKITKQEIVQITCSIGISTKVIADKNDLACLISEADSAMYHAKSQGRDQVVNFSDVSSAVHLISSKIR